MSEEHIRVVEINGIKMEVDLRTARRVDRFRVGDRVKVLTKEYGDKYKTHLGVIVGFDAFEKLPTITICYLEGYSPKLCFVGINANTEDVEIVACQDDDALVDKGEVLARLQAEIDTKQAEMEDLERKRRYFEERFAAWFEVKEGVTETAGCPKT